jgi:lipopolysaccharide transport system permease protein
MVIYRPESRLLHPISLFRQMIHDLWGSRELSFRIFMRDFNADYRQTFFGYIWAFVPPLLTTSVFIFLNKTNMMKSSMLNVPQPLFILTGMLYWQLFVDCLLYPTKITEASKNLISKVSFPVESLILAALLRCIANFLIRLVLLAGFCIWFSFLPGAKTIPILLFSIFPIMILGTCLGLFVLPFGLLYRDFGEVVSLSTTFLLFITPVGYYLSISKGELAWYFKWNPLLYLINFPRDFFFGIFINYSEIVLFISLVGLIFLFGGWLLFKLSLPIVFEKLSS